MTKLIKLIEENSDIRNIQILLEKYLRSSPNMINSPKMTEINGISVPLDNNTPLHYAIKLGKTEIIELLIKSGANINQLDSQNRSPLEIALEKKYTKIIMILIDKAAELDIFPSDPKKGSLLHEAIRHKNEPEIIKKLITAKNINMYNGINAKFFSIESLLNDQGLVLAHETPLYLAIKENEEEIVRVLVENGANINLGNSQGKTALELSIEYNLTKITNFLIDSGAEINIHLNYNIRGSLIHEAIRYKNEPSIIERLITPKNINTQDRIGKTALSFAASLQNIEAIKSLLKHKELKADIKDAFGKTCLHFIAENCNFPEIIPIISNLIEKHNADIHARDKNGLTALNYASNCKNREVAIFLLTYITGNGPKSSDSNNKKRANLNSTTYSLYKSLEKKVKIQINLNEDVQQNSVDKVVNVKHDDKLEKNSSIFKNPSIASTFHNINR